MYIKNGQEYKEEELKKRYKQTKSTVSFNIWLDFNGYTKDFDVEIKKTTSLFEKIIIASFVLYSLFFIFMGIKFIKWLL